MCNSSFLSNESLTSRRGVDPCCQGSVGIGLRADHVLEFIATQPPVHWVEAIAENYMGDDAAFRALVAVRRDYDVSLHGVGLSLGNADGLQSDHLARLVSLNTQLEPALISEHLSWSIAEHKYFNALLPLPYNEETLGLVCRNIDVAQHALGRRILVENVAAYIRFRHSDIPEPEFLMEVAHRTGCGVLCDITNIFVTCSNFGLGPVDYIHTLVPETVGEVHLGGYSRIWCQDRWVLFDDHAASVDTAVWNLYRHAVRQFGPKPTLIEWDAQLPQLGVLVGEARHAYEIMSDMLADSEPPG